VTFDDDRAVAGAGLALEATLSKQLGTFKLANELIDLGGVPGHATPGRKVLTLVHAMVAGADCIDDCDVLRSGATGRVLGHGVMAPSTLGTFLRAFTFGHVRQLDSLSEALLAPHTDACTSVNGGIHAVGLSQMTGR
jgi:pyruvate carboxylase